MDSGSDHEVIQFELTANESEWVESSLNASYNMKKTNWLKFAETLQINSISVKLVNLNENSDTNLTILKDLAVQFRNLIVNAADQHIFKRKQSSKIKVWWSESLSKLRTEMSSSKRTWKFNRIEDN